MAVIHVSRAARPFPAGSLCYPGKSYSQQRHVARGDERQRIFPQRFRQPQNAGGLHHEHGEPLGGIRHGRIRR